MSSNGDQPIHPTAFPIFNELGQGTEYLSGLTKREYFAAIAMQGLLSSVPLRQLSAEYAGLAVQCADALLKELEP